MTKTTSPHILGTSDDDIALAAKAILKGELVAFPTETVYGLGADATNSVAVSKIFLAKKRPATNPLIVHVDSIDMAKKCVSDWTDDAQKLAETFWPGPLSIILPKNDFIADTVTSGAPSVAVRLPHHPVAQRLIHAANRPIAAPSANPYTEVSPTSVPPITRKFNDNVSYIIDGGPCPIGIESTVLLLGQVPTILRLGRIRKEQLEATLGRPVMVKTSATSTDTPMQSPGLSPRHYSPRVPVKLLDCDEFHRFEAENAGKRKYIVLSKTPFNVHGVNIVLGTTPEEWELRLYSIFSDAESGRWGALSYIIIIKPVDEGDWAAVCDRLARSSN